MSTQVRGARGAAQEPTVLADVSPHPWDGGAEQLSHPQRELVSVSPAVASYITQEKAGADVGLDPLRAQLRKFKPDLDVATAEHRQRIAGAQAKHAEVRKLSGLGPDEILAHGAETKLTVRVASNELEAAVREKLTALHGWLDTQERLAREELRAREPAPTEGDVQWTAQLAQAFQLMPPRIIAGIAQRWLVDEPMRVAVSENPVVRAGVVRRAAALLPLVKGLVESNTNGAGSSRELQQVLVEADAVAKDRGWYAAQQRLAVLQRARWLGTKMAETYSEAAGDSNDPRAVWLRGNMLKELGAS